MFRKSYWFSGLLLVSGAAVLATPGLGRAQRGGHAGGGHFGGGHVGGFRGGFSGGGRGGGYHSGYPYAHSGYYHPYAGYGVYGVYPYYYGVNSGYYGADPYTGSDLTYDPGYAGSYGATPPSGAASTAAPVVIAPSYSLTTSASTPAGVQAHVTVKVPAGARLWIQDVPTTATGPVREFDSPSLTPGQSYTYDVRATWTENGHDVTQEQHVGVTAGGRVEVDFPERLTPGGPAVATTGH